MLSQNGKKRKGDLSEGLSVLRTEMNFNGDRLQLTGALESSDCDNLQSTFKALA